MSGICNSVAALIIFLLRYILGSRKLATPNPGLSKTKKINTLFFYTVQKKILRLIVFGIEYLNRVEAGKKTLL